MKTALAIVQKYYPKVRAVVDAKTRIDIEVTSADGKSADKKSPSTCALAKAFCRTYDGAIISVSTAYLIRGTVATRYKVSNTISRELVSFDRHHDFAPGIYSLRAPAKFEKLGPRKYPLAQKKKKKKKSIKQARAHRTTGIRAL